MNVRAVLAALLLAVAPSVEAQVTQRGFVETSAFLFPQEAPTDSTRAVVDLLAREEVFARPAPWIRLAGGLDFRLNSHDQVDDTWDVSDRGARRPLVSVRRLAATITRGWLTLDVGKQFVRWGKTDIVNPTDRFAPRDFLDVVDNDFLGVTGVRAVAQAGTDSVDVVWLPRFTPSRVPLLDQRWTAVPARAAAIPLMDVTGGYPRRSQVGVRWNHAGTSAEYSLSVFDGLNHLPNVEARVEASVKDPALLASLEALGLQPAVQIEVRRVYPAIRSYGGDVAVPTRWLTIKGEATYVTSATPRTDEYVLYVIQLERQAGEWTLVGGYAGEVVTERRALLTFAPDRGLARSIVGRVSYTIDANRSIAFETAVRQTGDGVWTKAEYSQARGDHWRLTATAAIVAGHEADFLGQYHHNSHVLLEARYSF